MNKKLTLYIKLPNKLRVSGSSNDEAKFYAKKYKQAKTDSSRKRVLESLIVNGSYWDVITRSCFYLNIFEKELGKKFPELWS